jgi:hypothetical protein
MKRNLIPSSSKPTSHDEEQSKPLKKLKSIKNSSRSEERSSTDFYTDIAKYRNILHVQFHLIDCRAVSQVDDIMIYREGTRFHAISVHNKAQISRNIKFDYIHQVSSYLLLIWTYNVY